MTYPDTLAALARERVTSFLSEAQAGRQASLARAARAPARPKRVVLRNGSVLRDGSQEAALVIPPGIPSMTRCLSG